MRIGQVKEDEKMRDERKQDNKTIIIKKDF